MIAYFVPANTELINGAVVVFWTMLVILVYTYVGYPALLAVLSTMVRQHRPEPGSTPPLTVLIAAYNEEVNIERKIRETLALDYPPKRLQVLVLSDGSTDRTDSIVNAITDSRVQLVRLEEHRGKTHAQNEGVRRSNGEVLVFSDATAIYHSKALMYLACNYQDPAVGAVSGRYQYFDATGQSPTALGSVAFWNYENIIKRLQSKVNTITGCCGCIYSVRKAAYSELADDVISDLVQPLAAIRKGYKVVFEDRALAYEETTSSTAEEFSMRVRVVTRSMRGLLSVSDLLKPWKFPWPAFQLWSHKVLRWSVPAFLLGLLVSNAFLLSRPGYRVLFLLQGLFYLFAILSTVVPVHRHWKPLGLPLYFCTLNAAALLSFLEVRRGHKYIAWQTVRRK